MSESLEPVDAWHGVMDALPPGMAADLRIAAKVLYHIGRALNHECNGMPVEYYETALNDAAAESRHRNPSILTDRINRLNALADAVEMKELAQ